MVPERNESVSQTFIDRRKEDWKEIGEDFVPLEDEVIEIPHVAEKADEKESKLAASLRYAAIANSVDSDASPKDPALKRGLRALMRQATQNVMKKGTGDRTEKSIWFKTDDELAEEKRLRDLELNPVRLFGWQGTGKIFGSVIDNKKKSDAAAVVNQKVDPLGGKKDVFIVRLRDPDTREWLETDLTPELLEGYAKKLHDEDQEGDKHTYAGTMLRGALQLYSNPTHSAPQLPALPRDGRGTSREGFLVRVQPAADRFVDGVCEDEHAGEASHRDARGRRR